MVEVPSDTFEELVRKSTEYDKFVAAGYNSVEDVNAKVAGLESDLANCRKTNEDLQRQIDEHQCPEVPTVPEIPDGWTENGLTISTTEGNKTVTTNYKKV